MKNGLSLSRQPLVGCSTWLPLLLVFLSIGRGPAVTPYEAIVGRNVFGLKPPANPADLIKSVPPVVVDIKLQGITTILGRKQVLMKINVPARPGEAANVQSLVLSEGQREGEVEVLEINTVEGTVLVKNNGSPLSLNMKDNADKPTPGAAPAPGVAPALGGGAPPPGLPRPVLPGGQPMAAPSAGVTGGSGGVNAFGGNGAAGVSTFGGNDSRNNPNLPTRTLRTGSADSAAGSPTALPGLGASQPQSSYQPPASNLSVDEQMAVLAVQHAAQQGTATGGMLPPLPAKYRQQ